jgi:Glycosyl transferase family 11
MENTKKKLTNVVSCYLMGGLGNQLFQIFTTLAYGMRTNRKVFFPYTDVLEVGISRPTYWQSFLNSLLPFTVFNRTDYTNIGLSVFPRFNEAGFRYSEIPNFTANPEVLFVGYFQSYKYFDAYRDQLFLLIRLQAQREQIKKTYTNYFTFEHAISMHFRLGDYKAIQDAHPLMTYDYYRKALNYILSYRNQKVYRVLYFCEKEDIDDVNLIINRLRREFDIVEFLHVDPMIPDWQQMLLMSCCQDNIIANSSFSWFGAYFNTTQSKIVCYPNEWFGTRLGHDISDLCPKEWNRIFLANK